MRFERMKQRVCALSEVVAWPEMMAMVERAVHQDAQSVWEYPVVACEAVGGTAEAALPAAAAIFCSLASIHLVDDMLDDDPRGDYRVLGVGNTANLALAFQAAAHRVLDDGGVDAALRAALQSHLAGMALATAFGQNLDAREPRDEEDYWRAVEAKTPPLFAAALAMGALLGGAPAAVAEQLGRLGAMMGRFVQVSDDLVDALQEPAGADWRRRMSNLPILYALTADHPERAEFARLCPRVAEPAALAEAHKILLRSGAVSYCAFKLIEFARQADEVVARIPLADPGPVDRLLAAQRTPLDRLFRSLGVAELSALALH
jgi:geranylgeranyl pyrophosphate synthase